jgi:flavin reductase (DIM6/NTAB) family NADH-FMN oxidoreductase RutF
MSATPLEIADGTSPLELRGAFACFPSGVTGVCALIDGEPVGIAASSFVSVSLDPPLVSFCISHDSTTWPVLRRAPRIGISVMSETHDIACRDLAARNGDRFANLKWLAGTSGAVFLADAPLLLECVLDRTVPAGDHDIVLARVERYRAAPEITPLVFHGSGFRRLAPSDAVRAG